MQIELGPDGNFALTLPNGHTVAIPLTLSGLAAIRRILLSAETSEDRRIGTRGAPIQHMIDQWLKADSARKAAEADEFAKSLNIEIDL